MRRRLDIALASTQSAVLALRAAHTAALEAHHLADELAGDVAGHAEIRTALAEHLATITEALERTELAIGTASQARRVVERHETARLRRPVPAGA